MTNQLIKEEVRELLKYDSSRPYVFRTRLERTMTRVANWSKENSLPEVENMCKQIKDKLRYISDQSNQTVDGSLKSFKLLENDIVKLIDTI